MKTIALKLVLATTLLSFLACKDTSKTTLNYTYANEENSLKCENIDTKLFTEALLSFEDDITKYYDNNLNNRNRNYSLFFKNASSNRLKLEEIVSPHSLEVFNALKTEKNLWNQDNSLNYNHPIFTCIGSKISDKDLSTTFNALVSTNSMRRPLYEAALKNKHHLISQDNFLALYAALDYFYAGIFNIDPTKVTEEVEVSQEAKRLEELKEKLKKENETPNNDPHAGHNH
ncbi:MAG: hypothetical protein GYB39_00345 [Algicola sp.]|nr:hypothetical protein [Algicola sp.]